MAPRPDLITPLGWQMLRTLPPFLRNDPDYRAIIHCSAREFERFYAKADEVRAMGNPLTAPPIAIPLWEALLRLPRSPDSDPIVTRRLALVERWRSLTADPAMSAWVARITVRLSGAPWTYERFIPESMRKVNVLPYGSMDADTIVGTGRWLTGGAATLARDTARKFSGQASLRIEATAAQAHAQHLLTDPAYPTGSRFMAAVRVFAPAGSQVRVDGTDSSGALSAAGSTTVPGTDDWQLVTVGPYTSQGDGYGMKIRVLSPFPTTIWADEATVVPGDALPESGTATGDTDGWEWLGAPDASASREQSPVPAYTLRITLPFPADSEAFALAALAIRDETPSEQELFFVSEDGFQLDVSQLDVQGLGV